MPLFLVSRLGRDRHMLSESGPTSAEIGPIAFEFGALSPDSDQTQPESGRNWSNVCQISAEID